MSINERGSSMLLVLLAIVIFSVLGLAIMGMSLNTAKLTEMRETDVQYIHLAEKELDRLAAEIYARFDGFIVSEDVDDDKISEQIEAVLNSLWSKINSDVDNFPIEVGDSCGTTISPSIENEDWDWDGNTLNIMLKVEVRSAATAPPDVCAKINRTLEQTITLKKVPDALQYAVGTEGQLTLNGAPYIIGDIYAGNNLYIAEYAEYSYKNITKPINTGDNRPILRGGKVDDPNNKDEKRKMYSNLFIAQKDEYDQDIDGYIKYAKTDEDQFNDLFTEAYKFKNKELNKEFKEIDGKVFGAGIHPNPVSKHDGIVYPIYRGAIPFTSLNWENDIWSIWDKKVTGAHKFDSLYSDEEEWLEDELLEDEGLESEDILPIDSLKSNQSYLYQGGGPLNISYKDIKEEYGRDNLVCSNCTSDSEGVWILVEQDARIEGPEPTDDNCPNHFKIDKVHFLINGNLEISGCIELNSAIYVNGGDDPWVTEIRDAYLKGIDRQALILFSKPPIRITRVNEFEDISESDLYPEKLNPDERGSSQKVLHGFFYSEGWPAKTIASNGNVEESFSESTLYGVGSRLWIKGGFFSKNDLTLNAYRGNVKLSDSGEQFIFTPKGNQEDNQAHSRLVIEYDEESIKAHGNNETLPQFKTAYIMVEIGSRQLK